MRVRLQKFISQAGAASRRAAEDLILQGLVEVNGKTVTKLGVTVDPDQDTVRLEGRKLRPRPKRYLAVNKPPGYLCTCNDPEKRPAIGQLLPREWDDLFPVGRLDRESEGLIFLTNDGEFSLRVSHPRYEVRKVYHVLVEGQISPSSLKRMEEGITDQGELLKAVKAIRLVKQAVPSPVEVVLSQGKNREIRRMFESLGHRVLQLKRIQIGPIKLGELRQGKWRTLTEPEIKSLLS